MKILEAKYTITEIKNLINEFNLKIRAELRLRKMEVRSLERKGRKIQ